MAIEQISIFFLPPKWLLCVFSTTIDVKCSFLFVPVLLYKVEQPGERQQSLLPVELDGCIVENLTLWLHLVSPGDSK